jgi:predicted Fe-Mo cluster-binding NifX family protein
MSKVGIMMDADRPDGLLSAHFGKAGWMMMADPAEKTLEFVKNEGSGGCGAVETAIRNGCANLVFTHIGEGALRHLGAANIRGWMAPARTTGLEALQMFSASQLRPATAEDAHPPTHSCCHGGAHSGAGCCSGHGPEEHRPPASEG